MDAKILRKWGLKAVDEPKDSLPSSPTSFNSVHSPTFPVDYNALRAWLPPIPPFERQRLSSDTLEELKKACAVILKETAPDDAELDQTDPLEEYRKAVARAEATESKPKETKTERKSKKSKKDSPRAGGRHRSHKQNTNDTSLATSTAAPDVRTSYGSHTSQSLSAFPQPPKRVDTHKTRASNPQSQDFYRQKPHKAASSDYIVQDSHQSSRAISRITTAYATQAPQTERSSLSYNANDQSRSSHQRISGLSGDTSIQQEPQKHPGISQAWVSQGRPQEEEINALPQLHKKSSRASLRNSSGLRSRAESIRDGIREYVRPGSRSSSRPATSQSSQAPQLASEISRPESRGSVASTGHQRSWWRGAAGALRRKGSFNSFRSNNNSAPNLTEIISPARDIAPDLDKSLPPMPSLDTYVEPKVHISQLMVPIAPSVPQGSLASPAEAQTPHDIRSTVNIQPAMDTQAQQTYFNNPLGAPYGAMRHNKSPALTPASENVPPQPRPISTKSKTMPVQSTAPVPRFDGREPNQHIATQDIRTYYSPAHQHATTDLAQFSDAWRDELIQKDDARRREQERLYKIRKQEKKRLDNERRKVATASKGGKEKLPGIKNRLSKMFGGGGGGAAAHVRAPPPPSHNHPDGRQDDMNGKRRDRQQEVLVAN